MGSLNLAPAENEDLTLSLSQREVWLDQRAWPDSAHLNIGGGAFLMGSFDLQRFKAALAYMVAENEALRLAPLMDGSQRLLEHMEPDLEIVDLSDAADPMEAMRTWWQKRIREPFVLDGTPPWRFALLRANDTLHGLTIQFHHLVMDGWGTSQVMKRWSEIYNDLEAGAEPVLSAAPGYRQFIEESNAYRHSAAFEKDADYWREQMPTLPLPLLERRYAGAYQHELPPSRLAIQRIPRPDYDRLRQYAADHGTTSFNLFLAAIIVYFARVCNRQEIVVGVPSLNRGGRRYMETLGMFVGVFPLRVHVTKGMSIGELITTVGATMRTALRHPRYPLSELGRTLQVIRNSRDGLFDVLLSFERQDYAVSFGKADLVDSRQLFSGIARYPLGVTVCEFHQDQDLELALEGSSACFTVGEVELLGRRFWRLAEALMAPPETLVENMPILPVEEHWALIDGLHKDVARHDVTQSFISMFEHQAALRPEATALVWDGGSMDYETLNHRANHLAHRLASLGIGRDDIIAVAIARSTDMVVALLAIAKAGAAFLPLDPDAPVARLAGILDESGALALLIQEQSWDRLAHLHIRTLVTNRNEAMDGTVVERQSASPAPNDLAYVLFTSGSTGKPKGVMVEHAALSRRLAWLSRTYAVDWHDRSAQATQLTFDPALIELFLPLIHGASVALPPPGILLPESLADFAVNHGVTIMAFVPSTLTRFIDAAGHRPNLKLRVACCGGEVLSPELANRFLLGTGARLYNVYGPTETVIFATAWECKIHPTDTVLPIGRPVDDTRIYVLDHQLQPLPFGVAGEIFIGGDALARGYLNRPDLDKDVFLDDPFRPGARMYRTGDRGWLDSEGNLQFIGRLDRQIKLRGYRIELGEIETTLLALENVTQAAAKLVERKGKPLIYAWVATSGSHSQENLQRLLRERLPDYMIPSGISILPALPSSSAGKIDYDALLLPERASSATRPASNKLERELLFLWEDVLDTRPIGIHDNFFDLGGDSLGAVSILAGIERLIGRKVPIYFLAEYPTIEQLATALSEETGFPGLMVSLGNDSGRVPLYLAASGHGDLLRFQNLAKALRSFYDLHMLQPPIADPITSIADLATLYADRIEAQGNAPGYLAGFSVGGVAALETARLLQQRGIAVRGLFLIDTVYPNALLRSTTFWRLLGGVARHLHVQELSINGRRLGAMFNDPGLVAQVLALDGYRPASFDGPTLLVKSSGLIRWDRWLFRPWHRLMAENISEHEVPGLHGSIFETSNVTELAAVLAETPKLSP